MASYLKGAGIDWQSYRKLLDQTISQGDRDLRVRCERVNYSSGGFRIYQPALILLMSAGMKYAHAATILQAHPVSVRAAAYTLRLPPLWGVGRNTPTRKENFADFEIQLRALRTRHYDPKFIDRCLEIFREFRTHLSTENAIDFACNMRDKKVADVLKYVGIS